MKRDKQIGMQQFSAAPSLKKNSDTIIRAEVSITVRLTFNGYTLVWHGSKPQRWTGFCGPEDESANEADKDIGPTPHGMFKVNPARIETWSKPTSIGSFTGFRFNLMPQRKDCLRVIRTGM